jgi:hypothetical protein
MTINTTTFRADYAGNGVTDQFPVPFIFFGLDELQVIERDQATGIETILVRGSHYNVAGGDGTIGTVTATPAPAAGKQWTIRRNTATLQQIDFNRNDPFPSDSVERGLDRATAIVQEALGLNERTLRVPTTDPEAGLVLPASVARANKLLGFDAAGAPIASPGTPGTVPVTAYTTTLLDDSTALAARTTLELGDVVFPEQFGALGDGTTDDSAAWAAAIATGKVVLGAGPAKIYLVKDLVIGNHGHVDGRGSRFKVATGGNWLFKLTAFYPTLQNIYVSDALALPNNATTACIIIEDSIYPNVENVTVLNGRLGLLVRTSTSTPGLLSGYGYLDRLRFDTFTVGGIRINTNVTSFGIGSVHIDAGQTLPDQVPKAGTVGFAVISTGAASGNAVGGHLFHRVTILNCQDGIILQDAELIDFGMVISDTVRDRCVVLGDCQYITFAQLFTGTGRVGLQVNGASDHIQLDSFRSILQGVVPPFYVGPASFYEAGAVFDVQVLNTSSVEIDVDSWMGDTRTFEDAGARLVITGGERLFSNTVATVAAATITFMGPCGVTTTESGASWIAPYSGRLRELVFYCDTAPGAGETFTCDFRVNGVSQAFSVILSGAAAFAGRTVSNAGILFARGDSLSFSLTTSASAAAARHRLTAHIFQE